jgi:mRNA interferase RelE/StbE
MNVEFLKKFNKDLDKIDAKSILENIEEIIEFVENAEHLSEIPNVKKLTGYKNAYRIRMGDYRIGIFFENDTVEFARIVHRKDIYKVFP